MSSQQLGIRQLPVWQRGLLLFLPALCAGVLIPQSHYVARTVGVFAALLAALAIGHELSALYQSERIEKQRERLSRWLPVLVIITVAAALLAPTLIGLMPQSQDHPVHLTRAWHFVTRMLARGQLSGWSDLWFAGWPAGEDYPPGADMWIATVYLGTLGLLGWEWAYGLAFTAMFATCGLALYHFGKTYFGRFAGLAAGVFFLIDRGQYREGGWSYTVWWGVWPQILSTAFFVLSLSTLDKVITRGRPRDFAICALCTGFAVLAHPMAVVYFGMGVPLYLLTRLLADQRADSRLLLRCAAALAWGMLLSAYWLLPFVSKSAWMAKYGELYKSLPAMARGLWNGSLFDNITPPLVWLALLGGALAAWRRNAMALFVVLFGLVVLFISSSTAYKELGLPSISASFEQIQFQRFAIPVKVALFLLAGFALQTVFGGERARQAWSWRGYALTALVLVVASPFVEPVGREWGRTYGGDVGRPKTKHSFSYWGDYERFLEWSAKLKQTDKGFFRIAYLRPYNDHFFAAAPVYNGIPAYKVGYTPCTNFTHKPDAADPTLYRALSVKYVVAIGSQAGKHLALHRRFGPIHVYRFLDYSDQRYTLIGPGEVKVEQFDAERARLRLSNTTGASRLIFHQAIYPNWRASVDGEKLPISAAAIGEHDFFVGVPAKDGLVELRYGWPLINVVAACLSWLAVGGLLLLVIGRYRRPFAERLAARLLPWAKWCDRHARWIVIGGVALLLVIFVVSRAKPRSTPLAVAGESLLPRIAQAEVSLVSASGSSTPCRWRGDKHHCSAHSWNYVGVGLHKVGAQMRRCIWAHPVDGNALKIRFANVSFGRALVGHHGLTDDAVRSFPAGAAVTLDVEAGSITQRLVRTNKRGWAYYKIDTRKLNGQRGDLTFTVSTPRAGGRHYCFGASVVQ
ncbi:MAG: hypothetical protein H6707_04990 [Deltaproteobacteria bacterium]|nr:hypothetical protein [Deltaproteobacteria bacterium]